VIRKLAIGAGLLYAATAFAQPKPADPKTTESPTKASPAPSPTDDPWANRKDLFVPPTTRPSTKVNLGVVERYTLANGLQVIAVPRHGAPVVNTVLFVSIDEAAEPLDRSGLGDFTAEMLHKGTASRTADQIADTIDTAGVTLNAVHVEEGIGVVCSGRSRDLPMCLDMTSDVSLHPSFPQAEMAEVKDQLVANVEQSRDNPQVLAREHAFNLFYGDKDPRGRGNSKKSLGGIDRGALVAFHDAWFHPNHAFLAVAGDFDGKALKAQLEKFFGAWGRGEPPKTPVLEQPKAGPMQVRLVDKPDATQAQIVILGPGIRHADPDLCAVRLMNYSLGGGAFSSRLMKVVRSENAKTYHASSHFQAERDPGPFEARTFTREAEASATVKLMLGEIDKMKKGGPTAAELSAAKANLIGGYGLQFETASDVAFRLVLNAVDGLAPQFATTYPACLDHVTLAQAAAAARSHLQPDALVVLGNAANVGPQLASIQLGTKDVVSYTDPVSAAERNAEKAEREAAAQAAKKAASSASQADIDAGKKVLAAALKAKGADSIAKINDLRITGVGSMTQQGQNAHIGFDFMYVPSKIQMHEELSTQGQDLIQVLDGDKAFVKVGFDVKDMPAKALASQRRDLWRNPNFVLLNAMQPGVLVRAMPPEKSKDGSFDIISVLSPEGETIVLAIDQKTHLLAKEMYNDDGEPMTFTLGDYKAEAGIQFARKVMLVGPNSSMSFSVDKVKVNKGLPKDAFQR